MADFSYSPDFRYQVNPRFPVAITEFENGYEQRRLIHSTKLRTFDLKFTNRTKTEFDVVAAFYDAKYGALTAFTISLDGEEVTVRFVPDSFAFSPVAYQIYDYGFQVQEVPA